MRLDHVSYAAGPEGLAACVQRLGGRLGAGFTDGGLHPLFGTRNFVLPLAGGCYVEVVEALDHPAVDQAPFGRAVRARSAAGGGWMAWVIAVDDLPSVEQRLGRAAAPGRRRRPDGVELRWKQIGINDLAEDPALPFFVHWESGAEDHPSAGGGTVRLTGLELAGDEARVDAYLGTSVAQPLTGVTVKWVDGEDAGPSGPLRRDGDAGLAGVWFETANGAVRID